MEDKKVEKPRHKSPPFHTQTEVELAKDFNSDLEKGLTQKQVLENQAKYGLNELDKPAPVTLLERIKEQFEDNLVRLLILAAVISFIISVYEEVDEGIPPWVEPAVIFTILIGNAVIGIWQDYNAEKALDALKDLQSPNAEVLRDGNWKEIPAKFLVPGDIVKISQGNRNPADIRLIKLNTTTLKTDESILTGEVNPVSKTPDLCKNKDANLAEKHNILYKGTLVSNGIGIGIVVSIGMKTEVGNIQAMVQQAADEEEDTPLKKKLNEFGDNLTKVIGLVCVVIWAVNARHFMAPTWEKTIKNALYYFKISVALAVAAIPEGLPAVITTCLALGTKAMAKKNAIIRKLTSVETLGCTTIICSDKTGTLTTNQMVVEKLLINDSENGCNIRTFDVKGTSYQPKGVVEGIESFIGGKFPINLAWMCSSMSLCNESKLMMDQTKKDVVTPTGLPTEAALKVVVEKLGYYDPDFKGKNLDDLEKYNNYIAKNYSKLATLEFTRDRKSMSVICGDKNNKNNVLFIKGAPDYLLNKCKKVLTKSGTVHELTKEEKDGIFKSLNEQASRGLRTLAITYQDNLGEFEDYDGVNHKSHYKLLDTKNYINIESEPILLGLVAVRDPPRPTVKKAISDCRDAGISVIMITGDIKETALSIAKEIGIIQEHDDPNTRCCLGAEFIAKPELEKIIMLKQVVDKPSGLVFARTEPAHKQDFIKILSDKFHQIVAMTGDGVNDAPALRQAHIGIAMGIAGTEVAKEASKMVLADDNFSTIVAAVEQGRAIYSNMKSFIRYMISSNIGEVISIFVSSILGLPESLTSIQLLWVNLVTDGLPATALSFNPAETDLMSKPPRKSDEAIVGGWVLVRYLIVGTYIGLATVGVFVFWYVGYGWADDSHQLIGIGQLLGWRHYCHGANNVTVLVGKEALPICEYFEGAIKAKPTTMSLTVLALIEMFNALNALSDHMSLFKIGIFGNMYLIGAMTISMALHCVTLYLPVARLIFATAPLTCNDWIVCTAFALPVFAIEEVIKYIDRNKEAQKELKLFKQKTL